MQQPALFCHACGKAMKWRSEFGGYDRSTGAPLRNWWWACSSFDNATGLHNGINHDTWPESFVSDRPGAVILVPVGHP